MNRLLFAVCFSAMLSAASAQSQFERAPVGSSVPPSATPPRAQAPSAPPPAGSGPLEKAKHFFNEKSWQLAVNAADEADTATLTEAAQRELLYMKGRAWRELGREDNATNILNELIKQGEADIWTGRAHWRLQPGLHDRSYLDTGSSDPLHHLRAADRILTDAKPDDLLEFYLDVINSNLPTQYFPQESERDYILSFFDKVVPLLTGQEDIIAGVQLRRQTALNSQRPERTPDERLAGLRGIVAEFPRTRAAAQAQWQVAQTYIQNHNFVPALYELSLLTNQFAGTEEAGLATVEIEKIKRPEARFTLPAQFLPGEKISFVVSTRNTDSVRFSAVPFDAIKELKNQKTTRPDLKSVTGKAVLTDRVEVDNRDDYHTTSRTVTLDIDDPGAYVLRAEVDGKVTCNALLVISNLALVGNAGPQGYEFWTVNAETGKPAAGVDINVAHNPTTEQRWLTGQNIRYFTEFAGVKSATDGFATFDKTSSHQEMFAVAHAGDHIAFLDNAHWSPFSVWHDQPHGYLYTDRPVYRPEQKVYWRAIIRDRVSGQYKIPAKSGFRVVFRDPRGQEVYQAKNLSLSDVGSLQGEFTLPTDAPLGQYNMEVWGPGNNQTYGHGNFRVEEYKKPEFEVSVESAEDFAKVGQQVKAQVEAKYLFGSPVTDATVKYTVRSRPRFRIFWEHLTWHLDDQDLGWFEDAPERPPTLHGSGGVIVAQGEGKLDADGQFTLTFDSTVPDDELNANNPRPMHRGFGMHFMPWPPVPPAWEFQVEVTVTDASRRNIDASQVIPVGLKALNLAAKTQRRLVTPGDNARVELKSMNLADKPVPSSGTLFIEKLVWNESARKDDITTISSQQIAIEASGSLVLDWRVPDDARGHLRFAYIVDDPFGGKSVAYADFYSAAPDDTDVYVRYQGIEIIADQTRYTVGDTARFMILSEHKDATVWYWIDTGSGNLHKQAMPLAHRTNFVTVPITEAFVPNSKVHIVAVRDKQIVMDEVELIVPPTSKVLNVQVTPAQSQVEPGQQGQVTIKATDENGNPVSGEFSLSIFDQAITYIAPDTREDIRKALYGMKRPLRTEVQASLSVYQAYGGPLVPDSYVIQLGLPGEDRMSYFAKSTGSAMAMETAAAPVASRRMAAAPPAAGVAQEMAYDTNFFAFSTGDVAGALADKKKEAELEMPAIRADFRDSMFWSPTVRTDADGRATVSIKYPDSLTTWKMVAVGLTPDTRVGNATTETIARKKVMVRLQAPRFFRERDTVTLSANLHNYTDSDLAMNATLRVQGVNLEEATTMPLRGNEKFMGNTRNVTVPAGGEKRVDWKVVVDSADAGEAILNLAALSAGGSDAMQTTVPLLPHGIDKFVAWNGTSNDQPSSDTQVTTSGAARVITRTVSLPAERIKETSRLEIIVNPSLASSIREAIPYMIEYPYGCVEQTMSRFMPATVAARAFQVLGYPLDRDLQEKLPKVTEQGMKRLQDMQLPSGSWGWWANDSENLYMTAYVMYGFTLARDAEVSVDANMYQRGLTRLGQLRDDTTSKVLEQQQKSSSYWWPNNLHNLMFAEYVLTLNGQSSQRTIDVLWQRRDELSAHGLAMLARTMGKLGRSADAEVVLRNMVNMVVISPENNTARWGRIDSGWRWYDDPVEATAVGLMAYLELKPDDPLVDQAMKWLVLNRQGGRWKSTKDSAQAVLALTQFMLQRNEAAKPMNITVTVGEQKVRTLAVDPSNFWDFDGRIVLRGAEIPDGEFPVSFTVEGEGTLYYSIYAEYFTLEENIQDAGNEIYVTRTYEKLHREQTTETVSGKPTTTYKDSWLPLNEGDPIASGDELRVTLKIKSLNDYEYLVFEDPKPAGMEPVDLQSGSRYGDGLCSNMELRDKWVAFFITHLRQGEHSLSYRVRAEIPGTFHVMPTTGFAMYFPPLRANSDEAIMSVVDPEVSGGTP